MTKLKLELDCRKRNNFHTLHRDTRTRLIRKFHEQFANFNQYLNSFGLNLHKIELKSLTTDETDYKIKYINNTAVKNKDNLALIVQRARDRSNMSGKNYIRLKKALTQIPYFKMPGLNKIDEIKIKMNKFFEIKINDFGAYVNVEEKIQFILSKIYLKLNKTIENDTFHLRFAGDGAMITKTRLTLMNFTFTVLNEKKYSADANYLLGVFKIESENYENIKNAIDPIIEQLEKINTITIDNKEFKIVKYASGDLKFLALTFGINAANSTYPCNWCLWNSKDSIEENIDSKWSISGRSLEDAKEKTALNSIDGKMGYKNLPILKCIDYDKAVVDPMHMGLRIIEKLIDKLIAYIAFLDGNNSVKMENRKLFQRFIDFIENDCKVNSPFYLKNDEKGGKLELRSLNYTSMLKIIKVMFHDKNLFKIYPEYESDEKMQKFDYVLKKFYNIHVYMKRDHSLPVEEPERVFNEEKLSKSLKKWLVKYLDLIEKENQTIPVYVHIMVYHVPEFISKYKNLNLFSTQGLEKLNDQTKSYYFRQTNHINQQALSQLMEKKNRMELNLFNVTYSEINAKVGDSTL